MRVLVPLLCALLLALSSCRSRDTLTGVRTRIFDRPSAFDLEFEGVRSLSAGLLQRAAAAELEDFVEGGFRAAPIDDAAYAMAGFYRGRGFPDVRVEYELETADRSRPRVLFRVEEGPRCTVGQVRVRGASAFEASRLARFLRGSTTQAFGLGSLYYVKTEAQAARGAIESLYLQSGYLEVRVEGPEVRFDQTRTRADIEFQVVEGPHFVLREVELGDLAQPHLAEVRARLDGFVGRSWFPRVGYELRAAASAVLADRGYPEADATSSEEVDRTTGDVRVRLEVQSGPEVRLKELLVEGNERTRTSFILSLLGMQAGDLYRREAERRAFRALYATGLFDSVELLLEGEGSQRSLRVVVEESETLELGIELGYGSFERARLLLTATEQNLFGTGRSLHFEGKLAQRASGARLVYTDPYTIDRDNVLGATLFAEQRQLPGFDSLEIGTGLSLTRHWTPRYRNVYGYEYRLSEANDVIANDPALGEALREDAYVSSVYLTNVYDTRESFFLPRNGTWLRFRTEFAPEALGSELNFLRLDGRLVRYHPLDDHNLIAWTVRGGVIIPTGVSAEIPLQERFYNGGQNTVRSFKEDELGPVDGNGVPLGGEAYSVLSVEYRRELVSSLSAALFVDAGNVSSDYHDALEFTDLRYGLGPGLRWLLPIGPVRLDWGINPNPRPNERDWVLQFSLGVAF